MLANLDINEFQRDLRTWYAANKRDLPWRNTRDPYAIWLSEVMLQQTRVAAVIPYFQRFLARFPNVGALAAAPESELLAQWAGLGYYYRARNLQRAAQTIDASGQFPAEYEAIRQLPGIGDYTAAAVASIAFELPFAVVDGNVLRVLSRVFNDATNIATQAGRRHFARLATEVLDKDQPGTFNQAMMELGATVCLPKAPQCLVCPASEHCKARAEGRASKLPVKLTPRKTVREERTLFWIERDGELLVWQRKPESSLMPGFWELPEPLQLPLAQPGRELGYFRHGITFHEYRFKVMEATAPQHGKDCRWRSLSDLAEAPLSTVFRKAMRLRENLLKRERVIRSSAENVGGLCRLKAFPDRLERPEYAHVQNLCVVLRLSERDTFWPIGRHRSGTLASSGTGAKPGPGAES